MRQLHCWQMITFLFDNLHIQLWPWCQEFKSQMPKFMLLVNGPGFPFVWLPVYFFSNNREEKAKGPHPIWYPSSSSKDLHPSYHCPNPPVPMHQLLPVTTRNHLSSSVWWSDERKVHQEVRAKLLGRKPGGLVNILKENPADELESNLCCLSRGFNVLLHFLLGPTFWREREVQTALCEEGSKTG